MSKSSFVDFKAVKSAITMEQVLQQYNLLSGFKKSGDSLSGPCPIHKGSNPTQFRVSVSKNIWNCFSECKNGGNTLDFIAQMDNISIHAAALKAMGWFNIDPAAVSADSSRSEVREVKVVKREVSPQVPVQPSQPAAVQEKNTPNPPLKFRLEKLDREHPYLAERGLTQETIIDFGIGFCAKGMMAERIAIPIHNVEGKVVAYSGRWPGEPPGETPKYKLPQGFRKSMELFNLDRAIKEPADQPLVIVEGFFGCMTVHQLGHKKVVALMGSSLSPNQEDLILRHTNPNTKIILIMDEDDAGRAARQDIVGRLSKGYFVKAPVFSTEGWQADNLTHEDLAELMD